LPRDFEAYARIFFPFAGEDIVTDGRVTDQDHVTWTETARRSGGIPHALMERERSWQSRETTTVSTN
jgi:hypothetical protein